MYIGKHCLRYREKGEYNAENADPFPLYFVNLNRNCGSETVHVTLYVGVLNP